MGSRWLRGRAGDVTKVRLTQAPPVERATWHTEPAIEASLSVRVAGKSVCVAGPVSVARDLAGHQLLKALRARDAVVECVYVTGSPDDSTHLVQRNGSPILAEGESFIALGAAAARWLQLSASPERAQFARAFEDVSGRAVLLVIGNFPTRCFEPTLSLFVPGEGFRARADTASRRVRDLVDIEVSDLSAALAAKLVEQLFT